MNNKRHYTWLIALTVIIGSFNVSCSDNYYDTEIGGRITPEQHYKSKHDAEASVDGCYAYLQDISENLILLDGLRSDQMEVTSNANGEMVDIYRHELSASNQYIDPSNFYKMIINVNEVLPYLPGLVETDRYFDTLDLQRLTGSLTTLRCWAYLNLARLNGEVGLVDGNLNTVDLSSPPVYLTKDVIIDTLIETLLPFYDTLDLNRFDIDHYILLGELYLEKNDYENAAKYLKYAVDGPANDGIFMVNRDYEQEDWKNIFINSTEEEDNEKTVFTGVPYSYENSQGNNMEEWMNYRFDYVIKPTDIIVNQFNNEINPKDEIGDEYRGKGVSYDSTPGGSTYINKYSLDPGIPHSADAILYRAADVHLLLAEALNRMGETKNALALINEGFRNIDSRPPEYSKWDRNEGIRGRAYLKPNEDAITMVQIEDLIIEERAKELAFEGKRWFDLVRIANRRNDPSYLADKVAAKYSDPITAQIIKDKLMNPANWYVPFTRIE